MQAHRRQVENASTLYLSALQLRDAYAHALVYIEREKSGSSSSVASPAPVSSPSKTKVEATQPAQLLQAAECIKGVPAQLLGATSESNDKAEAQPTANADGPAPSRPSLPEPKLVIGTLQRSLAQGIDGITPSIVQGFQFMLVHLVTMQRAASTLLSTRSLLSSSTLPDNKRTELQRTNFSAVETASSALLALQHKVYGTVGALAGGRAAEAATKEPQGPGATQRTQQYVVTLMQDLVGIDSRARQAGVTLNPSFPNPHYKNGQPQGDVPNAEKAVTQGQDSQNNHASPTQQQQQAKTAPQPSQSQSAPQVASQPQTSPTQPVTAANTTSAPTANAKALADPAAAPTDSMEMVRMRESVYIGSISWSTPDPKAQDKSVRKDVATHITASVARDVAKVDVYVLLLHD